MVFLHYAGHPSRFHYFGLKGAAAAEVTAAWCFYIRGCIHRRPLYSGRDQFRFAPKYRVREGKQRWRQFKAALPVCKLIISS